MWKRWLLLFVCWTVAHGLSAVAPKYGSSSSSNNINNNKVLVLVEPSPLTYGTFLFLVRWPMKHHYIHTQYCSLFSLPNNQVSGYANRFQALFQHLNGQENPFGVVTVDVHTKKSNQALPESHLGAPVHHTMAVGVPFYDQLGLSVDLRLVILRTIVRMRPSLLHVSSPGFMMLAAIFYSRLFQIPLVASYHTHLPVYVRSYVPRWLGLRRLCEHLSWMCIRFFHSMADATVVTSPQIQAEFQQHRVPKCFLWEKGIDTRRFHPSFWNDGMRNRMTDGHPDDFLMVYIGRLGKEKRLTELRDILERMPNTRLCIVGHGPYEKALRQHFAGTRTVFTGLLQGEELSQAFASADAFCMPSDSETLGFVCLVSPCGCKDFIDLQHLSISLTIRWCIFLILLISRKVWRREFLSWGVMPEESLTQLKIPARFWWNLVTLMDTLTN